MSTASMIPRIWVHGSAWLRRRRSEVKTWQGTADAVALSQAAIHRIARPVGYRIECIAGTAWLTQDGDGRDTLLEAGESYTCLRPERLLVQALDAVLLRVVAPATPLAGWPAVRRVWGCPGL